MMVTPIPFCGQAYAERSPDANAQRCINLYPVNSPTSSNPGRMVLYPTPGYGYWTDTRTYPGLAGAGAIRGMFVINDVLYAISGSEFLKYLTDGTAIDVGTLSTSSGLCSISCNTVELNISDGVSGYVYNLSSGAFTTISGGSWPAAGVTNFTFQDGYTLAAVNGSKTVIQSDLLDGGTFGAQAFAVTTAFPDDVRAVFSDQNQLYVFGPKLTEVRVNSAATPFAFEKQQGVLIQAGLVSWKTIARVGGSIIWLASDSDGKAYIAALRNYTPQVLSTPPINEAIQRYATISDAFAYSYREASGAFYCITFPSADTTWACDLKTGMWHQRSVRGGRDLPECAVNYKGGTLVGDASGKMWWMSQDYSTDDEGDGLSRVRSCEHIDGGGRQLFCHELEITLQTGVGLLPSQQGDSPLATLRVSRDGGHTWHSAGTQSLGRMGEYETRLTWRRLGRGSRFAFELTITDPVAVCVTGARARFTPGYK